jgi:hypothetical protein
MATIFPKKSKWAKMWQLGFEKKQGFFTKNLNQCCLLPISFLLKN